MPRPLKINVSGLLLVYEAVCSSNHMGRAFEPMKESTGIRKREGKVHEKVRLDCMGNCRACFCPHRYHLSAHRPFGRKFRTAPRYGGSGAVLRYTFTGVGMLFLLLGSGFLFTDLRRRHRLRRAYLGGNCVDARIISVREIPNVRVNGRNPFIIECSYTDTYGEEHRYQSRYLYSLPREDLAGRTVPVYIDRMNENTGFVDVDSIL